MPKTIEYPRTSYASAWEVAEVVDDTGGKCAIDTCARKLNRKVSGSFKAIIGSAVKFGLITSKRELLTTTNLFRRIKHAYDKQEEKVFHREAFLHPPLFTQICRKFRGRELPVHMLDVMLIREFGVEEINAQNVAKAFVEGARMVSVLDERNVVADIDQLAAQQPPRRELASTEMPLNLFRGGAPSSTPVGSSEPAPQASPDSLKTENGFVPKAPLKDAVSALFGLDTEDMDEEDEQLPPRSTINPPAPSIQQEQPVPAADTPAASTHSAANAPKSSPSIPPELIAATQPLRTSAAANTKFSIHITGPGMDTHFTMEDLDDVEIVRILLEKIRRQLTN